jgi:drug/metabolite transporter (DMT)-like permease
MILYVLTGSLMSLFIKLSGENVTVFLQIFVRNLMGVFVALFLLRRDGVKPLYGERKYQKYLFARSLAGFLGLVTYFASTRLGNLADVTIVNRTGPFFTTLFAVIFLKEKTKLPQWIALVVVFIGALIAANPSFTSEALPMLLAFICAILNGVAYTLLTFFRDKVHPMSVILHFTTVSTIASLPLVLATWKPIPLRDVLILLVIGALGNFCVTALTMAYRLAPASEISVYDQLSIVTSLALGWAVLHEIPGRNTLLGGAIVITASVLIFLYNRRKHRLEQARQGAAEQGE